MTKRDWIWDYIGQSEKQTDQAAKDLVSKFVKDAKKVDKKIEKSA